MKKTWIILYVIAAITFGLSSCKKGYTCACSSETGLYDGFDIHDTKKKAESKCRGYYKDQYVDNPRHDTIPIGTVHCEIQKGE